MSIWKHWCKGCGTRIEIGDAGYCKGSACAQMARRSAIAGGGEFTKEGLLTILAVDIKQASFSAVQIGQLNQLLARARVYPYDEASALWGERHVILGICKPMGIGEAKKSESPFSAVFEASFGDAAFRDAAFRDKDPKSFDPFSRVGAAPASGYAEAKRLFTAMIEEAILYYEITRELVRLAAGPELERLVLALIPDHGLDETDSAMQWRLLSMPTLRSASQCPVRPHAMAFHVHRKTVDRHVIAGATEPALHVYGKSVGILPHRDESLESYRNRLQYSLPPLSHLQDRLAIPEEKFHNRSAVSGSFQNCGMKVSDTVQRPFDNASGAHLDKIANANGIFRKGAEPDDALKERLYKLL